MKYLGTFSLITTLLVPGLAGAGSYGDAGTADATVVPPTTQTAFVWCPKLKTEIPVDLQTEMNCDDAIPVATARPAVAPARFRTGLFGLPPHIPGKGLPNVQDDDTPSDLFLDPTPTVATQIPDPTPPSNDPTPDGGFTSKWDRLSDLGVTPDNMAQQTQSFQDSVNNYFSVHGAGGDWSSFQP
jgi:hypothetical protein